MALFRRRFSLPITFPPWLILITGVVLGGVLTSTFTFHLRWCNGDKVAIGDLSLDRQTLSIIRVNEHIRTHGNGLTMDGEWERERNVDGTVEELESEDCACGDELKRLKALNEVPTVDWERKSRFALDATYKPSRFVTPSSAATYSPSWDSVNTTGNYTHPTLGDKAEQLLSEEFLIRRNYIVAVNVPDDGINWASVIYDTWGQDVPQILFFISETCNKTEEAVFGLPLVTITGIDGTNENSVKKTFAVIKYLHEEYQDAFDWYVLVSTQTFVWARRMDDVLSRFDSSKKVYLGWAARGRPEDSEYLQLLPDENYCLGGPGMVFSNAALKALGGEVSLCLESVERHNLEEKDSDAHWKDWDVEIGRCVSRTVGIHCSKSTEARAYFYYDFSPKATFSERSISSPPFNYLLTYFPVTSLTGHTILHYYYKSIEYYELLESTHYLKQQVDLLCMQLELDDSHQCNLYVCPCEEAIPGNCGSNCHTIDTLEDTYRPVSKLDTPTWEYFDSMGIYNDEMTSPSQWFSTRKDRKKEIQSVMNQILLEARAQTGHRLMKFRKVLNGYVRHNPFRGMEYIVDAEYIEGKTVIRARTSLVRPLANNYITLEENIDTQTVVNFIVPISDVNVRFEEFMKMYEECCLKQDNNLHLILVVYGEKDIVFVKKIIKQSLEKFTRGRISVIEGKGTFARGKALHLGMSSLSHEDLAFLCDVDMRVSTSFLNRCRRNTIRGKRVYYPEFFKLYNLDYVYTDKQRPKKLQIKRQHGHWAFYSFGMLCIYKSDYDEVGGMDTKIIGWGEEDVRFYEMVIKKKNLEIFRVPDTGLTHRWHEKYCPRTLSDLQYKHCISSRAEDLADRMQLANYMYSHKLQIKYPTHSNTSPSNNTSLDPNSN